MKSRISMTTKQKSIFLIEQKFFQLDGGSCFQIYNETLLLNITERGILFLDECPVSFLLFNLSVNCFSFDWINNKTVCWWNNTLFSQSLFQWKNRNLVGLKTQKCPTTINLIEVYRYIFYEYTWCKKTFYIDSARNE